MGKWDKLLASLPPAPPEDLKGQEKINFVKDEIKDHGRIAHTPESLGKLYAAVRMEMKELEAARARLQTRATALEQLLADSWNSDETGWGMYGAGQNTVRLPNGDCIDANVKPYASVVDKEAFRVWCVNNGLEKKLQLWPTTTQAILEERLLEGAAMPDGVEATVATKIKFRPAKAETEE